MKLRKLKALSAVSCVATVAALCLGAPPGVMRTTGTVQFSYSTNGLDTNTLTFKLYSTNQVSAPVSSWPLLSTLTITNGYPLTVVGTNAVFQMPFQVTASQQYFAVSATNWHGESLPSNVASTPPHPRDDGVLRLGP